MTQISCSTGKTQYDSFQDAQHIVNKFSKVGRVYGKNSRRRATKKPKRAYHCPECGKYHLTSQKKKK